MQAVRQVWQINHRVLSLVLYYGWVYINDLQVSDYKTVKYADDTSFYLAVNKNLAKSVAFAIEHTSQWSANDHMILNADKTVIINFYLDYVQTYKNPFIFTNTSLLTWWSSCALQLLIILQWKTDFNEAAGEAWYEFDSIMYHLQFKH